VYDLKFPDHLNSSGAQQDGLKRYQYMYFVLSSTAFDKGTYYIRYYCGKTPTSGKWSTTKLVYVYNGITTQVTTTSSVTSPTFRTSYDQYWASNDPADQGTGRVTVVNGISGSPVYNLIDVQLAVPRRPARLRWLYSNGLSLNNEFGQYSSALMPGQSWTSNPVKAGYYMISTKNQGLNHVYGWNYLTEWRHIIIPENRTVTANVDRGQEPYVNVPQYQMNKLGGPSLSQLRGYGSVPKGY
jgi:hypothetical protein